MSQKNTYEYRKGRGSQSNPNNVFFRQSYHSTDEPIMDWHDEEISDKTIITELYPKSILSENNSPDLGFRYGINPYNGCEHGCTYCYARNSHQYWGYSAGIDFEQRLMVKKNAALLLEQTFQKPSYEPDFIMFSGNTDCYQPIERKFQITRDLLHVFLKYKHPVGIITKNSLILRDLDLLKALHEERLLSVTLSITTLNEELRRVMEPRASSVQNRLRALETLTQSGIPVHVNMAPIIMGLNSDEIADLIKACGERGAHNASYIMVRLNGQIAAIFEDWLRKNFPDRANKVLHQIQDTHGGTLNESEWGTRMRGKGKYAEHIRDLFQLSKKKYIHAPAPPPVDFSRFVRAPKGQLPLF